MGKRYKHRTHGNKHTNGCLFYVEKKKVFEKKVLNFIYKQKNKKLSNEIEFLLILTKFLSLVIPSID